jgi:phosphatidylinositol 4-kinase
LKKLPPPGPNIYLPTNPDTKVHSIIPEKSTALQSAAKAPILVAFECHTRDAEMEETDEQQRRTIRWTNSFVQACIFKVGDDVRQDMLALQIIDLFQRIFKSVNLDLFLYPYKVIATKPGVSSSINKDIF